ncbi:MAG: Fe-S cluster assembly protein SufD [Acidobacteria bacterium]|nr:MAG: Fe-S cluster assembly protein SufD [Acidobacteriota bacterium]REJ98865.1 MAG: Fe-S cluster assembly protein SufD [Acidobacteriota bacterium]REK16415.1 MAG: Fe-S cluster assembly protein SufD [Acidobacteriota bacterium]REK44096.1 MAG: Fe-S cluster assembly protein SufD [Acidobacteriota bacterium]
MSMSAGKETVFNAAFEKSIAGSEQPGWLIEIRRKAFGSFVEAGLPTVRNEEWKYTNVSPISAASWQVLTAEDAGPVSGDFDLTKGIFEEIEGGNRIVFVGGIFREDLSRMPEGVSASQFSEAYDDEKFRSKFSTIVDTELNGFTALNTAFSGEGIFLRAGKDTKVDQAINLVFIGVVGSAGFPRVLYIGETGSEAEIVEHYLRAEESEYLTNAVVEISLADEARLSHTRVQRESHSAYHVVTSQAELGRGSVYDNTNIHLGSKLSRHDLGMGFNAEGGEGWIDGLYLVDDEQHTDTHSRIDHRIPNCVSHQTYKGILDGKSRAVFNGKVFVHEKARGTDAYQSNKNLLLSNDARVDTKPQLEIFNDDVKCAHGATVGQLEEEELFYLLSRGLPEDLARNLLTYGFAEEVIEKIKVPSIKKALDEAVLSRLHSRLDTAE